MPMTWVVREQKDIDVENVGKFAVISSAKVNWGKSDVLMVGEGLSSKLILPGGLIWKKGGLKYLGVFLGDESFKRNNWDHVLEKAQGCFKKWKWILPNMSYRGRILVINNLVSSTLWHRLTCLDPPTDLLHKLQASDFFWDKLHWVPQSVLYLPKDEGGQGLVHLDSRGATFSPPVH